MSCSWYIFANCVKPKDGRAIDDAAWEKILSAFDQMAYGKDEVGEVLYTDEHGVEWCFILVFGCADMEQLCLGWGLKSYNNVDTTGMCGFCLANRDDSDIPYTNCQEDSEWRPTCPLSNDVS